jgi:uncharacterized protein (TIGR02118 family)
MVKFIILFRKPPLPDKFENTYNDFLALVERMPDVRRRQVVHVTGSPFGESPYYRFLEIYFDNESAMRAALLSPAGQEAGAELQKFPQKTFEVAYAEVFEETGGRTETPA